MELKNYIPDIISQNNSSEEVKKENLAVLSLQSIVEYVDEKDTRFITLIDWKEAISDVVWHIKKCLGDREKEITRLTSIEDPEDTSISADGAFSNINNHLNPHGIQMGYIDDFSDSYHIILYNIKNQNKVESAINKIGLPYMQDIT